MAFKGLSPSTNNISSGHLGHASENDNGCMPHFHINTTAGRFQTEINLKYIKISFIYQSIFVQISFNMLIKFSNGNFGIIFYYCVYNIFPISI